MILFKKEHIEKILNGEKTQTRRTGKRQYRVGRRYRLQRSWFEWTDIKILITRRFRQKLGEISPEDVKKEGYNTLEEFRRAWIEINGNWNPEQVVNVYEFKLSSRKNRQVNAFVK